MSSRAALNRRPSLPSGQLGVAVIEAAIILPLVIFLMLAVAEIGRAISQYNTLTKAVRDAARYVADTRILAGGDADSADFTARKAIACNLVKFGNPGGTPPLLLPSLQCNTGDIVYEPATGLFTVTANYTFVPAVPIPTFGFGSQGSITFNQFTAEAVMRALK